MPQLFEWREFLDHHYSQEDPDKGMTLDITQAERYFAKLYG